MMPFDDAGYRKTQTERDLAVLRAAREGIARPGGWCQGVYTKGEAHCALGWLAEAMGQHRVYQSTKLFADRMFGPLLPPLYDDLIAFNDTPPIDQSEIVYMFDRAIARLEASDALAS
jgi:hypothetical protein